MATICFFSRRKLCLITAMVVKIMVQLAILLSQDVVTAELQVAPINGAIVAFTQEVIPQKIIMVEFGRVTKKYM